MISNPKQNVKNMEITNNEFSFNATSLPVIPNGKDNTTRPSTHSGEGSQNSQTPAVDALKPSASVTDSSTNSSSSAGTPSTEASGGVAQTSAESIPNPPSTLGGTSEDINREYKTNNQERGRGGQRGRRRRQRLRPHEIYTRNQSILQEMFTTKDYKKFHIIKRKDGASMENVHMFRANNKLIEILQGRPKRVSVQRDGTLLLEVENAEQCQRVRLITKLDEHDVETRAHQSMNQTKGTIRNKQILKYTNEEITQDLNTYNNNLIVEIYRCKTKFLGDLVDSGTFILTFDTAHIPEKVKLGWNELEVREYIPRPRRCFQCQVFGHGGKSCREEKGTCVNCGNDAHGDCTQPPKCSNCDGSHPASDRSCFYYKMESEILTTMTKKQISYGFAKKEVTARYVDNKVSFAQMVSKPANPQTLQMPKPQSNTIRIPNRQSRNPRRAATSSQNSTEESRANINTTPKSKSIISTTMATPTVTTTANQVASNLNMETTVTTASKHTPAKLNLTQTQLTEPITYNDQSKEQTNILKNIPTVINTGLTETYYKKADRKRANSQGYDQEGGNKIHVTDRMMPPYLDTPRGATAFAATPSGQFSLPTKGESYINRDSNRMEEDMARQVLNLDYPSPSPIIKTKTNRSPSRDRNKKDKSNKERSHSKDRRSDNK